MASFHGKVGGGAQEFPAGVLPLWVATDSGEKGGVSYWPVHLKVERPSAPFLKEGKAMKGVRHGLLPALQLCEKQSYGGRSVRSRVDAPPGVPIAGELQP